MECYFFFCDAFFWDDGWMDGWMTGWIGLIDGWMSIAFTGLRTKLGRAIGGAKRKIKR